ncbi:flagellar assembly peptidoglycan hydrolase FlgJ [Amphritea sp. 1_MG-2023]|uniref:flagellar assembly peptidoglycan hydrolase FlgJ n=1 Tax=Amphritea sp. 1_MG-2023 TaxID=3062670 RepID=UPI0026E476CB|nr:flagellar assembly peptidoglycan hydrolase FlgJ [Amphritea sp. 1_MG-2023]MDO6564517.1 flagellar assembly peptidoglycan hydrolase FlgJ [Amphritea sp. 1_MG-2023]
MKTDASQHAQLYTELGEMNKLRQQAKDNDPAALQGVAEQFEQLFLNMLVKSMREANASFSEDSYFNSPQVEFYQQMGDTQLTKEIAENKGFGLAEILVRQLGGQVDPRIANEEEDNRLMPLSSSERLLNRTVDSAASMAASAILGRAQANSQALEEATAADVVSASEITNSTSVLAATDATESTSAVSAATVSADNVDSASIPQRFETPEQFVETLLPLAENVAAELGVDPKVLLAQAALETGWGRYVIQTSDSGTSHNLFNIKADSRWEGEKAQVGTVEFRDGVAQQERAAFRVYDSYEQSFRDYADFLQNSSRYQQALEQAGDPYDYLNGLQQAGYATDPEYAQKISRIFDGDVLAGRNLESDTKES